MLSSSSADARTEKEREWVEWVNVQKYYKRAVEARIKSDLLTRIWMISNVWIRDYLLVLFLLVYRQVLRVL